MQYNEEKIDAETLREISVFNRITKTCFKQCVRYYNSEVFINEEEECLKNCAEAMALRQRYWKELPVNNKEKE